MQDKFPRWPAPYAVPEISAETTVDCIEKFAEDYGYPGLKFKSFLEEVAKGWDSAEEHISISTTAMA